MLLTGVWNNTLKEVLLVKSTSNNAPVDASGTDEANAGTGGVVQIFNVLEHGRRYYRSLVFTSDSACCFHDFSLSLSGDDGDDKPPAPGMAAVNISNTSHTAMKGNPDQTVRASAWLSKTLGFTYLRC